MLNDDSAILAFGPAVNVTLGGLARTSLQTMLTPNSTYVFRIRAHSTSAVGASIGWSMWSSWLHLTTEPPRPPARPDTPLQQGVPWENNATTIRVVWSAPVSYGLPITKYELELDGAWRSVGTTRAYVVRGLTPSSTHTFRVRAHNKAGTSEVSDVLNGTTAEAQRPTWPTRLRQASLPLSSLSNVTSIRLTWSRPSSDLPIFVYLLRINESSVISSPGSTPSYTITDLYPGSILNVSIAALSDAGRSDFSDTETFALAPPTVPQLPYVMTTGSAINGISPAVYLPLHWRRLADGVDPVPITGFRLLVDEGTPHNQSIDIPTFSTRYNLFGLRPHSNHTFSVCARNHIGYGEQGPTTTLTTQEGSPPSRCSPLALNDGDGFAISDVVAFHLAWSSPYSPAYPITGYQLRVLNTSGNVDDALDVVDLPGRSTSGTYRCGTRVDSLCAPNSTLVFTLAARNERGLGDFSRPVALSTAAPRPPRAPLPVSQRTELGYWQRKVAISVFWRAPNDEGLPIEKYELEVTNPTDDNLPVMRHITGYRDVGLCGSSSECTVSVMSTAYAVQVWQPLDKRTFRVRAYNLAGWSNWSGVSTFQTGPPEVPLKMSPPLNRNEDSRPNNADNCSAVIFQWRPPASSGQPLVRYETRLNNDSTKIKAWKPVDLVGWYTRLAPGEEYRVEVRSVNAFNGSEFGAGPWSNPTMITTQTRSLPHTPAPPAMVTVGGVQESTTIPLSFRVGGRCSSRFTAQLEIDNATVEELPANSYTSCLNYHYATGFLPGTPHQFRLRVSNEVGLSNWSEPVTYWTKSTVPSRPSEAPELVTLNSTLVQLLLAIPDANGHRVDAARVEWLHRNSVVGNLTFNLTGESNVTLVTFSRSIGDSEAYRYAVHNLDGWSEASPALVAGTKVTFEPAAPTDLEAVAGTLVPRSVNLSLELPTQSASPFAAGFMFPITRVDITVESSDLSQPTQVFQLPSGELTALCGNAAWGPCHYKLSGLVPLTNYTFKAAAFSEGGKSLDSPELHLQTPPDVPSPVRNVQAVVNGMGEGEVSDSISVSWEAPLATNGRAISEYVISVCDLNAEPPSSSCSMEQTLGTNLTVTALTEGRNYSIGVEAFNEIGSSGRTRAPKSIYTTFAPPQVPRTPAEGPPFVGVSNTTSIHAVWTAPFSNGLPLLRYHLIVDGAPKVLDAQDVHFTQYIWFGLIPGTRHNLSVEAINAKGASGFSPVAWYETAPDVPGPPSAMSARTVGSNGVHIEFGSAAYSGGRPVLSYQLESKSSRPFSQWAVIDTLAVSPGQHLSFDFHRVRLDLEYRFRVRGVNAMGNGLWSAQAVVLSEAANLPPAPQDLSITAGSVFSRSVGVEWRMPFNNGSQGIIYYVFSLASNTSGVGGAERDVTPPGDRECLSGCSALLSGLTPSASYLVRVSAVNGAGVSLPSQHAVHVTLQAAHPDPISTLTASVLSTDSIIASWTAPLSNGHPLIDYTLYLCNAADVMGCLLFTAAGSQTLATLSGLPSGRNFTLSISARNSIGPSSNTSAPGVFTTWHVPQQAYPPHRATPALEGLDPKRSLHVRWALPFDNGRPIELFNLSAGGAFVAIPNDDTTPQYVLGGLVPGSTRNFRVQAINAIGKSPWSEWASFTTTSDVPGTPPEPSYASDAQEPSRLEITVHPAPYSGGEPVQVYELWYVTSASATEHSQDVYPPSLSFVMTDRAIDLGYTFKVRARSVLGASEWSDDVLVPSISATETPRNPVEVTISDVASHALTISWRLPADSVAASYYKVKLSRANSSAPSYVDVRLPIGTSCTASPCTYRVLGLRPFTPYDVSVAAVNSADQPGFYSRPQPVHTDASVPDVVTPLTITTTTPVSFSLQWGTPHDNGRPLTEFVVFYCVGSSHSGSHSCQSIHMQQLLPSVPLQTSVTVTGLTPGTDYVAKVEAFNLLGSSGNSSQVELHTLKAPSRPPTVVYQADVPHALKIHSLHIAWSLPDGIDHGEAITEQQLLLQGRGVSGSRRLLQDGSDGAAQLASVESVLLDADTRSYEVSGLQPNTRVNVKLRVRNSLGWSNYSAESYMITDPTHPGVDVPPQCSDIYDVENGTTRQFTHLAMLLSPPYDNGEAVTARQLRISRLAEPWLSVGSMGAVLPNGSDIVNTTTVEFTTDSQLTRAAAQTRVTVVGGLDSETCYTVQVRSGNALGWSDFSGYSEACCTGSYLYLRPKEDALKKLFPAVVSGSSVVAVVLGSLLICLWLKLGHLNAQLFGGLRRRKRLGDGDGEKRVAKFMDSEFTPGLDDADDVAVNPVLMFQIEEAKRKEKRAKMKRVKVNPACMHRSGGLARLKLDIDPNKGDQAKGGKAKNVRDVEEFLAKTQGIDVAETRKGKNKVAGKGGRSVMQAVRVGPTASEQKADARALARAAMRGGAGASSDALGTDASGEDTPARVGRSGYTEVL